MQTLKKLIVLQWELEFSIMIQQVNAIPPTTIKEDAHWDIDYVWKKPGNHIVYN